MKQQHFFIPTLRDNPADAEVTSHQLMVRAGLIRPLASGLYTYLPLAQKVLIKLQQIIREEMEKANAQEVLMPALQPAEIWQETGRWDRYGPELIRLTDRHERSFALGPTHEEVITGLIRNEIRSYKRLPLTLYQIQTKFRDERRPRFGVLRAREFIMKDAYSFDLSWEGLEETYQAMFNAYQAIFDRCQLTYRAVEADSGAIGGTDTHEFMVLSEIGEDTIAYCPSCDYAANVEKAEVITRSYTQIEGEQTMTEVETPQLTTVEDLVTTLGVEPQQVVKAVALAVDDQPVVALVRGDFELNEVKVKTALNANHVEMLDEERIRTELNSEPGFIGPIGLDHVKVVADHSINGIQNGVLGANKRDKHLLHAKLGRDFNVDTFYDLRQIEAGDPCPHCREKLSFAKGIEVGHIFKLGTQYSEEMKATFLNEEGKEEPFIMGCYGIGVTRLLAAVIEQHHDEHGIVWPKELAPFDIHLISVNPKQEVQKTVADQLYDRLKAAGYDVLYDNRTERAGVKFADADLIGIPLRIIVGKNAGEGLVECKQRKSGVTQNVAVDDLFSQLPNLMAETSH